MDVSNSVVTVDEIIITIGAHSDTHIDTHIDTPSDALSDTHNDADIDTHNNAHIVTNINAHSDTPSDTHNNAHNNAKINSVALTQQVQLVSNISDNPIILLNTEESEILVKIPDQTKISAPNNWDKTISPPKIVTTTGIAPLGFAIPTSAIQIGSPDVVLVFDSPVTIILNGVTDQMGYKLSGTTEWVFIDHCLGTFDSPTSPIFPGECYITDGTNTKILTYHFTEFTILTEIVTSTSTSSTSTLSTSTSSTGGSGRTGVGPTSGGSSGYNVSPRDISPTVISSSSTFPNWFKMNLVGWWVADAINDEEFKSVVNYLLNENIIDIQVPTHPGFLLGDFPPSTKYLFQLWHDGKINDLSIIKTVHQYRVLGIW